MITWPTNVVSDIARRRCVIFLGSGISRNSKNDAGRSPRTWLDFLKTAAKSIGTNARHVERTLKEGDFLTACELIKMNLGEDAFTSMLIEEYLAPRYKHAEIHESIFKLDSRIVATPNFDKIFESYANHTAQGSVRIKHQYDDDVAEAIRRNERLVLKVHGTIDTPRQMIFTRAEYADARTRYRAFYKILEALALTHTFIFLGCGINDPDIRLLLEDSFFRYKHGRPHVFVLPSRALHPDVASIVEATMNVKILTYDPVGAHVELKNSIDLLVRKVEAERDEIRASGNW